MVKRPVEPFWNASHNAKPKQEPEIEDPSTIRDKDNADRRFKPPSFAPNGEKNRAPKGMAGIKRGLDQPKHDHLQSIAKTYPLPALLTEGHFMESPEHKFLVAVDPFRSPEGLEGGKITELEIQHQGSILVQFKDGQWTREPESPAYANMVQRLQNEFGDVERDFQPIAPPDHDKDRGHER